MDTARQYKPPRMGDTFGKIYTPRTDPIYAAVEYNRNSRIQIINFVKQRPIGRLQRIKNLIKALK